MWSSRLFWKLFLAFAGLNLVLAGGVLVGVTAWQRAEIEQQLEDRLHGTAVVFRSHVREYLLPLVDNETNESRHSEISRGLRSLVERLSDETATRLTVIDAAGDVLVDSERDAAAMINHANREELIAARETGRGTATRQSPTLGSDMFYLALPVMADGETVAFVRVSVQLDFIQERVGATRRALSMFALGVGAVTVFLVYVIVGSIIHPLSQLTERVRAIASDNKEEPVPVSSQDEIGQLAVAFNQMHVQLAERVCQLRENNEQMATIFSSMDEGVLAVNADERIVLANETSRVMLEFVTGDAIGRPLLEVSRSRPLHDAVRRCLKTGRPDQGEFESSGNPRRVLAMRATCLPGNPSPGAVVLLHETTELRRLENLRQEFVANVSHELKTPLAAIKAYAETLRLGAVNDTQNNVGFVTRIEEQANRLEGLILDMLQIARVESGREAFEISDVLVKRVIDDAVAQYHSAAGSRQLVLQVEAPTEPLSVRADERSLRSIVENLIDNAIKYTPSGGTVTVRWIARGAFVALTVQDSGIGIAEADQARVFERFYRVDKARSRELGGTGLGLSIVKHLCQAFGGSVDLASQPGQGSTFTVRLPIGVPADEN